MFGSFLPSLGSSDNQVYLGRGADTVMQSSPRKLARQWTVSRLHGLATAMQERCQPDSFPIFSLWEVSLAELCDSQCTRPSLPDLAGLLTDHRVSLFAAKGLGKRLHVGERAVVAKTRERVRVGVGLQARCLCPLICTPHLGPSEEEALLRREAVDIFRAFALDGFLVCSISDGQASEVADALAEHELAVLVQAGLHFVAIELIHHAVPTLSEVLAVVRRPPLVQVAFAVKFGALIVKAMADFVADDGTNSAVVHSVVGVGIVKGRLKDAGGKNNLVHAGVVVGVYGRRRHAPLRAVHRLSNFVQLAGVFKFDTAANVGGIRAAVDSELGIIAPFVGVADLHVKGFELGEGFLLGIRSHPGKRWDVVAKRGNQVVDHFFGTGSCNRGKVLIDISLSESFTEVSVRRLYTTLPARQQLLRSGELSVIEIEILLFKSLWEARRAVVDHMPTQIDLPVGQRNAGEFLVHLLEEFGLAHVDLFHRRSADVV